MTRHDSSSLKAQALIAQVSPEFTELTADIREVMSASSDSVLIAALLFKLAQERKQTNELLSKMEQKYDELSFFLKSNANNLPTNPTQESLHSISLLPDADQKIMTIVEAKGSVDAEIIRSELNYKNPNAASQRLNALVKAGHLGKIQSGKKVVFVKK